MYAGEYAGDWLCMLASALETGHVCGRVRWRLVMYVGEYAGDLVMYDGVYAGDW